MFSPETLEFLAALRVNNSREWFNDNRETYHAAFRHPAHAFAESLSGLLEVCGNGPVTYKTFRISRDLRFSWDKTPYNTHLHMAFVPANAGADGPAWMVGLEPGKLTLGAGIMAFTQRQLEVWRECVAGSAGEMLRRNLDHLLGMGCRLSAPDLVRVPRPFAGDHPRGDLLRRKGLVVWWHTAAPQMVYGNSGPAQCQERLRTFTPIMIWLSETMSAARQKS